MNTNENPSFLERAPMSAGLVLGVFPLPLHLLLSATQSYQVAALSLILIAGVYLGYAFQDGRTHVVLTELTVATIFLIAGWFGMNGLPILIVGAFFMHGLWDYLHHTVIDTEMPRWYIPFCAIYDFAAGAGLATIWWSGLFA